MRHTFAILLLALCVAAQQASTPSDRKIGITFEDVTAKTGITFSHKSDPEKKYIVESMSGGVALFDYDNDGWLDIYFVNSLTTTTANDPKSAKSALYRNLGNGKFEDVSDKAGVAYPGWGMGVCVADLDGNGYQDMYVTALGPNRLYRNNGDGTFTDIAEQSGVTGGGWSAGCGFADYDRDGNLDLFVSRYVKVDLKNLPEFGKGKFCEYRGVAVQCGPRGLPGDGDFLFRNLGNGKFSEVGKEAGVSDPEGFFGLGIAWFDFNEDGWLDLFVANDSTPNFLYKNLKNGKFEEVAFPMGVAVSEDGAEQGCMGVGVADYDLDGHFDLFVTNFAEEYNALYRYSGPQGFNDTSFRSKTAPSSLPLVGWGTAFMDMDNDGFEDLVAVNGHVYPQMDQARLGASARYRQRKLFYRNNGDGTFVEFGNQLGSVATEMRVQRGLAMGDLNNDGKLDIVTNDLDGAPQVLMNSSKDTGNWLQVRLVGTGKLRDGIGAIIRVTSNGKVQSRVIRSGTSYISQDDMRQHFGLGSAPKVELVEVIWPGGTRSTVQNVLANQVISVKENNARR